MQYSITQIIERCVLRFNQCFTKIRKGKNEVEKLSPTPKRIKNTKARKKLLKEAKAIAESEMFMMKRAQAEAESKSTK